MDLLAEPGRKSDTPHPNKRASIIPSGRYSTGVSTRVDPRTRNTGFRSLSSSAQRMRSSAVLSATVSPRNLDPDRPPASSADSSSRITIAGSSPTFYGLFVWTGCTQPDALPYFFITIVLLLFPGLLQSQSKNSRLRTPSRPHPVCEGPFEVIHTVVSARENSESADGTSECCRGPNARWFYSSTPRHTPGSMAVRTDTRIRDRGGPRPLETGPIGPPGGRRHPVMPERLPQQSGSSPLPHTGR